MKKITLFLGLLLMMIGNIRAQENSNYGFYLGCGINWMKIDSRLHYDDSEVYVETEKIVLPDTTIVRITGAHYLEVDDAKTNPTTGFMLGGFYELLVNETFGIQFDLMYNQYGYKVKGTVERENADQPGSVIYDYNATTRFKDISFALLAKIHLLDQHLSVDLGVQPSYCARAERETHKSISVKNHSYSSGKDYRPFNLSVVGGVTGCLGGHFLIGARYNLGLLDLLYQKSAYYNKDDDEIKYLYSNSPVESKTSSVQITVGYKF